MRSEDAPITYLRIFGMVCFSMFFLLLLTAGGVVMLNAIPDQDAIRSVGENRGLMAMYYVGTGFGYVCLALAGYSMLIAAAITGIFLAKRRDD